MENMFWLNLASKDIAKTKEFFRKLGFKMNESHEALHMVSMFVGNKEIVVNFFPEKMIQEFAGGHAVVDAHQACEVLLSFGANSKQEVDAWAERAVAAGGTLYAKPGEKDGWMYGCGFVDVDGHRWNVLFMDFSKMPKG